MGGVLKIPRAWKVYSKNCRTREVRQVDLGDVFGARELDRADVLAQVNHWNRLSAENEDCLWLYWMEP